MFDSTLYVISESDLVCSWICLGKSQEFCRVQYTPVFNIFLIQKKCKSHTRMVEKLKTRCFSKMYLTASALSSPLSLPSPILDTPDQNEPHHQGQCNEYLRPLTSQEDVGTTLILARERLGGLLKYYYREAT